MMFLLSIFANHERHEMCSLFESRWTYVMAVEISCVSCTCFLYIHMHSVPHNMINLILYPHLKSFDNSYTKFQLVPAPAS